MRTIARRHALRLPLGLLALAVLLGPVTAGAAQVIKLGTIAPEGSPWHDGLLELAQRWREISGGRIDLRIYPGGVSGDEPDMIRKMRIGQLHAAALTTVGLTTVVPDIEALAFPTVVHSDAELDQIIRRVGPVIEGQLAAKGFKVLNWSSAGWVRIFAREPVVTVADLQRQKLFVWGQDAAYMELLRKTGMNPIPLAITDLLPSLETGLVNAFAAPPAAALAFQWFALAKHMTDFRWQPMVGTTVVSMKTWQAIPEPLRGELEQAAHEGGARLLQKSRALEQEAIRVMQQHGLVVHEVPPPVAAEWRDVVREKGLPVFVGPRFSQATFDAVQAALADYRAGHEAPAAGGAAP
jgi:TRAP-type C4-dicarboxylate transport system substrate-binding protein